MIIGFAGKAASGKTTAAKFLVEQTSLNIQVIPMATVLREEVVSFLKQAGAEDYVDLVYGDQQDKVTVFYLDPDRAMAACSNWADFLRANADIQDRARLSAVTVRRILQWWGTEFRRAQDPDYWTKAWERKLATVDLDATHVLVDDVRFVNELNVIKKHGGRFVRIIRPGFDGANNHSSENSLDDYQGWDLVLDNDGTLAEFKQKLTDQILPLFA